MHGVNHSGITHSSSEQRIIANSEEKAGTTPAPTSADFAELYARYSGRLYSTLIAITKHSEDAEDALQETFLRAYLSFHTFEGRSHIYSWLMRIAINAGLMILRKRRAHPEILFDPQADGWGEVLTFEAQDSAPTPEEAYDLRHRQAALARAIGNLDPTLRRPIQMRIASESSIKQISETLKISEAAAKTRLYRARLRLLAAYHES